MVSNLRASVAQRLCPQLSATQTPALQEPQDGGAGGYGNLSAQDPCCSNPSGVAPNPSTSGGCLDPRVLQRNPDVLDNMTAFPSTSNTLPSLATMSPPLESSGPARPPRHDEHDPLAGPASPSFEAGDVKCDDSVWEFLRFEGDDDERTPQETGGYYPEL